ncbi:MAG: hypothetical protein ACJ71G_08670 [Nitrososphaeraceae archaeon]
MVDNRSDNTKGPKIIKIMVVFFSVSLLLFGGNSLMIMSYAQEVPPPGKELAPSLQQPQKQLPLSPLQQQRQQTGLFSNLNNSGLVGPIGPAGTPPTPPQRHISSEADVGQQSCDVRLNRLAWAVAKDVGRIFPEWKPVNDPVNRLVAVLEGTVTDAELAYHDWPTSHYSHDFNFHVRPDITSDGRYTNLLGVQIDPKTGQRTQQPVIEVEWESGLAASNSGNPLTPLNIRGESGGFFSAGHHRGQMLSFWPTTGDRVHVEGLWIWDRGHPPALTEIHPPHLVATQRYLPSPIGGLFGTEIDVFASGDGGAFYNNRPGQPAFVQKVPMNIRDSTFTMNHIIPKPSPTSQLKWIVVKGPGDTFPANPTIINSGATGVTVTIPWRSSGAPNTAVFARTIYLYWDGGGAVKGMPPGYALNTYRVTLDNVKVNNDHDPSLVTNDDGEYRLFANVGSKWFFLNEIPPVSNILGGQEGATYGDIRSGESSVINKQFLVYIPAGKTFRVYTNGWEADAIDSFFGRLLDQNHACDSALKSWLNSNIFTFTMAYNGCDNDPLGTVNREYSAATANTAAGQVINVPSRGSITEDYGSPACSSTNPNNDYVLQYRIDKIS